MKIHVCCLSVISDWCQNATCLTKAQRKLHYCTYKIWESSLQCFLRNSNNKNGLITNARTTDKRQFEKPTIWWWWPRNWKIYIVNKQPWYIITMINSESVKHVLYFNGFLSDSITDYIILLVWCCVLKPF